jgi:hypothetical protein
MTATPRMRAFEGVDGGDGNGGDAPLAGQGDHGQDAGGVAQGAIEAQLAQDEVAWGARAISSLAASRATAMGKS